jgi:protein-L-isoaspartate(D-aspartate) O-methyltransferase
MTDLAPQYTPSRDNCLEIGTGSGYSTAILAQLFTQVTSLERIKPLQQQAKRRLQACHYSHVEVIFTDGTHGYALNAPYDVILITSNLPSIPDARSEQLKPGGCTICPLGPTEKQVLSVVQPQQQAPEQITAITPVQFVPFLPGLQAE